MVCHLEQASQTAKAVLEFAKQAKKDTPKGKVFKGIKWEWFEGKNKNGWHNCGYRPVAVYEDMEE